MHGNVSRAVAGCKAQILLGNIEEIISAYEQDGIECVHLCYMGDDRLACSICYQGKMLDLSLEDALTLHRILFRFVDYIIPSPNEQGEVLRSFKPDGVAVEFIRGSVITASSTAIYHRGEMLILDFRQTMLLRQWLRCFVEYAGQFRTIAA